MDSYRNRLEEVQLRMRGEGIGYLLIAPSANLLYLTGIEEQITERLTLLAIPASGKSTFLLPAFEAARFVNHQELFDLRVWEETDDPYKALKAIFDPVPPTTVGVEDTCWARFLLGLQEVLPTSRFVTAGAVLHPLRERKRPEELDRLRAVSRSADEAFTRLISSELVGLSELEVSHRLADLLLESGSETVGFATVASGPHSASPHHTMGDRRISKGDALLFDFGGRIGGYYADVTRTVAVGGLPEGFEEVYGIVREAQQAAVERVEPGVPAGEVDAAAREVIAGAGYGEHFSHRVGHGVGLEIHEPPYLRGDSDQPLEPGMTFSVEPGIYLPGRFGVRIEDTVLVTREGGERLNHCSRELVILP